MTVQSATVTTLTAEVRVLMVGSRQITLSVFRQLDTISYEKVEPMGRVNNNDGYHWIVGRDATGVLVRAQWDWEFPRFERDEQYELEQLERCKQVRQLSERDGERLQELYRTRASVPQWQREYRESKATHDALPLIVLAGLR